MSVYLDMEKWLKSVADQLSIRQVELHIGCAEGTLQKVVKGTRSLPVKWEQPLRDYKASLCNGAKKTC